MHTEYNLQRGKKRRRRAFKISCITVGAAAKF
jgi:hypothetical protein